MAIDIEREELLTVGKAAQSCPGRPHVATVWRWILNGLGGVRLESVKVGGRRFTSSQALKRFIAAPSSMDEVPSLKIAPSKQRERAIRRAEKELKDAGL